eukprot:2882126-Pleurochrysis_carterae.AAC.2
MWPSLETFTGCTSRAVVRNALSCLGRGGRGKEGIFSSVVRAPEMFPGRQCEEVIMRSKTAAWVQVSPAAAWGSPAAARGSPAAARGALAAARGSPVAVRSSGLTETIGLGGCKESLEMENSKLFTNVTFV